jgi:hypothetical protein
MTPFSSSRALLMKEPSAASDVKSFKGPATALPKTLPDWSPITARVEDRPLSIPRK